MNVRAKIKGFIIFFLFLLNVCIWTIVAHEDRDGLLTVSFLDVGQGDAIFIDAPNGNQLLIDGGKDRQVLSELGRVMSFYDREIDVVIATHPDADHVGGLSHVLDVYDVGAIFENGQIAKTNFYEAFVSRVDIEGAAEFVGEKGMVIDLGKGATLEILSPAGGFTGETNDASIVARLEYGSTTVLLTGDATLKTEALLLRDKENVDVDVLKLGHHGSRTSTGADFLAAVTPAYAIVSAGKDNQYHHPHDEVIRRTQDFGTKIFGTYVSGTIQFISNGHVIVPK